MGRGLWTPDTPAASQGADRGVTADYYLHGHTPGLQHNHCSPLRPYSESDKPQGRVLPWTPKRDTDRHTEQAVEPHSRHLLFGSCQQVTPHTNTH